MLVIFALLMGGRLYGIVGAFLALPLAAIVRETRRLLPRAPGARALGRRRRAADARPTGRRRRRRRRTAAARSAATPAADEAAYCAACGTELAGADEAAAAAVGRALVDSLSAMAASRTDAPAALRADGAVQDLRRPPRAPGRLVRRRAGRAASRSSGPNGAGKTTLLQILAGALRADRRQRLARPPRGRLGPAAAGDLLEALRRARTCGCSPGSRRSPTSTRRSTGCSTRPACATAPATPSARCRAATSSGVNIAVGLLGDPPVAAARRAVLVARPAPARAAVGVRGGLAPSGGTTVVYSTHNVAEAERYADRLLVLADGELLFTGTPAELERATGEHDASTSRARSCASCARRGH